MLIGIRYPEEMISEIGISRNDNYLRGKCVLDLRLPSISKHKLITSLL